MHHHYTLRETVHHRSRAIQPHRFQNWRSQRIRCRTAPLLPLDHTSHAHVERLVLVLWLPMCPFGRTIQSESLLWTTYGLPWHARKAQWHPCRRSARLFRRRPLAGCCCLHRLDNVSVSLQQHRHRRLHAAGEQRHAGRHCSLHWSRQRSGCAASPHARQHTRSCIFASCQARSRRCALRMLPMVRFRPRIACNLQLAWRHYLK